MESDHLQNLMTISLPISSSADNKSLKCSICPHLCDIELDQFGICNIYKNTGAKICNVFDEKCSVLSIEPIEKRPFFHFMPGSMFLSIGFYGCSLRCSYCLNYKVSQETHQGRRHTPKYLSELATTRAVDGIAFSYNEPLLYHDYIRRLGAETSLPIAVKTNGFIEIPILELLANVVGAYNVDIKGDDAEYDRVMGGWLSPVKRTIEWLASSDSHLEVSYLVLPKLIDDFKYHAEMRDWLSELDPNIPVHILYYHPFHRMTESAYEIDRLMNVRDFFSEHMKYVYISNWYGEGSGFLRNTVCDRCKEVLIDRKRGIQINSLECCEGKVDGIFV